MIKPIETVYNGYKFRSRLEARWAVFFDACNIKYHYEPEGFQLSDGEKYLPDFYLDDFEIYVEIKPFDKSVVSYVGDGNKWEKKCRQFRSTTGTAILLCYGDPAEDLNKYLFAYDLCDSGGGCSEWECNFYNHFGEVVLLTVPTRSDRSIFVTDTFFRSDYVGTWDDFKRCSFYLPFYEYQKHDTLNNAKTKSRQARFEYGETPNT